MSEKNPSRSNAGLRRSLRRVGAIATTAGVAFAAGHEVGTNKEGDRADAAPAQLTYNVPKTFQNTYVDKAGSGQTMHSGREREVILRQHPTEEGRIIANTPTGNPVSLEVQVSAPEDHVPLPPQEEK